MSKLRVVHNIISYIVFLTLSISCNNNKDYEIINTKDSHLNDLLVDGASNTLIKFKNVHYYFKKSLKKV